MDAPRDELEELLGQLDPTSRTLAAEIDLGVQARGFASSPMGRYLVGCAQQEIAEAQEALAHVAPWRKRRIQELQNKIWRATSFCTWLRDAIVSGHRAGQTLDNGE